MAKYKLLESYDFGKSYQLKLLSEEVESLKEDALVYEKKGDRRWVILEGCRPIFWSSFIEAMLHPPRGATIASGDVYVKILLGEKGISVLSTEEMIHKATGMPMEEIKRQMEKVPKINKKKTLKGLNKFIKEKDVKMLNSPEELKKNMGKVLFGRK